VARHVIARVADLPPGSRTLVTVKGRPIAVFNVGGEFFGLFNRCPHQGGSLCEGKLVGLLQAREPGRYTYTRRGEILRCPWHGWEFDIRTGKSWCDPDRVRTRSYRVDVEGGQGLVEGPYVAETVPVTVDEEYLVIEA